MKTLICDCNGSMPLDAALPRVRTALEGLPAASADGLDTRHTLLCRREAPDFQRAARSGEELLVACTQESRLFEELAEATEGAPSLEERPIRFVNIREAGGWSAAVRRDGAALAPKLAALLAAAQLPAPDPVTTVGYRSGGRTLVIGPAAAAERAAALLDDALEVSLLVQPSPAQAGDGGLPQAHERPVHAGRVTRLAGWLGAFEVAWEETNPIDLDLCTRCNGCIAACPEGAIDFSYQIDLSRCRSHRDCVAACGAAGAIDFGREPRRVEERFDLVLDLRETPAFEQHQPPQGYLHAGSAAGVSEARLAEAVRTLRGLTGEFDKPKFFQYRAKLCAHSRNEQIGCTACIDVCSARAIRSDASLKGRTAGGVRASVRAPAVPAAPLAGIVVEPHLCVGCGACTTVCPSGALTFAYPSPADQGRRIRTMLSAYRAAGGREAALLVHSEQQGARAIETLGRAARTQPGIQGLPPRVLPLAVWHTASVGIDLWLSAIAQGASQVWVLLTDEEAPQYREALAAQMAVAQAILAGLGYEGEHLRLVAAADLAALDAQLRAPAARGVAQPAAMAAQADKRATLEMALDHLLAQAPVRAETIPLPAGAPGRASPFGSLVVDPDRCTMCLSCVGACPEAALADNPDRPQLRFIEKNCVQCGLCATTCPEDAITLEPRLWLADGGRARKQPRVLHEVEPAACIRCGKPFGTLKAVEAMMARLAGHAAFQGAASERLRMCGDCRVVDIFSDRGGEVRITDL